MSRLWVAPEIYARSDSDDPKSVPHLIGITAASMSEWRSAQRCYPSKGSNCPSRCRRKVGDFLEHQDIATDHGVKGAEIDISVGSPSSEVTLDSERSFARCRGVGARPPHGRYQ
jgi:hypothetical protein